MSRTVSSGSMGDELVGLAHEARVHLVEAHSRLERILPHLSELRADNAAILLALLNQTSAEASDCRAVADESIGRLQVSI